MTDEPDGEELANRVRTLADLAEHVRPCAGGTTASLFDVDAGPLDSFSAVVGALATEFGLPRVVVIRRLMEDMRKQIATDHAVLAHLLSLDETERLREQAGDREGDR